MNLSVAAQSSAIFHICINKLRDGAVSLDFSGKLNGRGAYICPNLECLKKAQKSKALDRSLEVTIPEEVYDRLQREMEDSHG